MIHGFASNCLETVSRNIGNMLHYAVVDNGFSGSSFMELFIQSGIAGEIENGNPKYTVGMSGAELLTETLLITGERSHPSYFPTDYRSDVYWAGWAIAHYQWYSGKSFSTILRMVPFEDWLCLYGTLHEADITKVYDVIDGHFRSRPGNLQTIRRLCGLTQAELAEKSGISLHTICAYERGGKDINKAQIDTLLLLTQVLKCSVSDLVR